jgi:hypothetical protein
MERDKSSDEFFAGLQGPAPQVAAKLQQQLVTKERWTPALFGN